MNVSQLIESVANGADPSVVARQLGEAETSGPDRKDVIPSEMASMVQAAIDKHANGVPYLDKGYVDAVLDQIRAGAGMAEISAVAARNRSQYIGKANVDGVDGGLFDTWNVIHNAVQAVMTDQLPPTV